MKIRDVRCAGLRGATPEGGWTRAAEGKMPTLFIFVSTSRPPGKSGGIDLRCARGDKA